MELLERIFRQNSWWESGKILAIEGLHERKLYHEIVKHTEDKQIISIVGLRRVGKTTLMFQVIRNLLDKAGIKRILYFSFDELLGKDPDIIEKVLSVYEEGILKEELKEVYVFFDEINHVKDWQVVLKRYYDLGKKIKFFVSGSSSLYLRKAKESLAGRIYEFELKPLDFDEYLFLKGIEFKNAGSSLTIKRELNNYLISGAFPEIIKEKEFINIKRYVNSIIEKVVFYDIPKVYDAGQPELLREIFSLIAMNPGMLIDYGKIASSLNMSYQTVSKYVNYLENSFLIRLLYNYRGSPIASARKLKKAYVSVPCLSIAFMESEKEFFFLLPKLAENSAVSFLNAKFFWRENYEIDILHKGFPIEVKYGGKPDIKNALSAARKIKAKSLIVVTKDFDKKQVIDEIKVTYIPLWRFLLPDENKIFQEP